MPVVRHINNVSTSHDWHVSLGDDSRTSHVCFMRDGTDTGEREVVLHPGDCREISYFTVRGGNFGSKTFGSWPFKKTYTIKGKGVITVKRADKEPLELEFGVGGSGRDMQAVFSKVENKREKEDEFRQYRVGVNRMGGEARNYARDGKQVLGDLALL